MIVLNSSHAREFFCSESDTCCIICIQQPKWELVGLGSGSRAGVRVTVVSLLCLRNVI